MPSAASTGPLERLAAVDARHYAVVLIDVQMPGIDGLEATRRIRAESRFAELPVISMTSHVMKDQRQRSIDAGMNDHVTKPTDPDTFLATVAHWAGKRGMRPQAPRPDASPPAPSAGGGTPVLDGVVGLRRVNNNPSFYREMLESFVADSEKTMDRLRQALLNGSSGEAEHVAHSLRGIAGQMGATRFPHVLARLETDLRRGLSPADPRLALAEAEASLATLVSAMRDELERLQ